MPRVSKGYKQTGIPRELWESIEKLLLSAVAKKYGYRSVTDFVIKAVRDKIEALTGELSI